MDDRQKLKQLKNNVVKSNELILKSRFDLSLKQQKMVLYLISQVNPYDEEMKLYQFKIGDFCKVCGIDHTSGKNYKTLKEEIKAIADKSIWVRLEDGRETLLRWIEKPYINANKGTIDIRLDSDMKPFLLDLNRNFTTYKLIYTMSFKSKYSIRLYETLCALHYNEEEEYTVFFSIDELRERLGVEEKEYPLFKNFNQRVLQPAIKEINQYSNKNVEYDFIKKGQKVNIIRMKITTYETPQMERVRTEIEKSLDLEQLSIFDLI